MMHYWQTVPNGFWFEQAYRQLLDALPVDRPSTWVEVGVFHGASLAWLGVEVINRGLPLTLHAVDTFAGWPGVAQGEALRHSFESTMTPLRATLNGQLQVHPMASIDAAATFADASCDVVWLDADHSYDAVCADIAAWWPKVAPGGALGGDDWHLDGVRHAVMDSCQASALIPGERAGTAWPSWVVRKPEPDAEC